LREDTILAKRPYNAKPAGRKSGSKNLKKVNNRGRVENEHGVQFTKGELSKLKNLVSQVNRKSEKMRSMEGSMERFVGGVGTKQTNKESIHAMGEESDFLFSKKRGGVGRFKTKEEYNHYMTSLRKFASPHYEKRKAKLFQKNHIKAIASEFGSKGDRLAKVIKAMSPEQYMKVVQRDEVMKIKHTYEPSNGKPGYKDDRINAMLNAIGVDTDTTSGRPRIDIGGISKYGVNYNPKFGKKKFIK